MIQVFNLSKICSTGDQKVISLRADDHADRGYRLNFSENNQTVSLGNTMIKGVKGLYKTIKIDLIMKDDIIDVSIDNKRCVVNRVPEQRGNFLWFYAKHGHVKFKSIKISPLRDKINPLTLLQMRKMITLLVLLFLDVNADAQSASVRFETNKGNITVMLYDATPNHRDMFLSAIKRGLYKNAVFNRVIRAFVSQGGELDDTILNREKQHPDLGVKRFPAELKPELFHKKGALGAGRDDNPEKASYFSQLYFVVGKVQTDMQLDLIEKKKGKPFYEHQREVYKTIGGTPQLDGDYTIFGEITEGMDVADAINAVI